MRSGHCKFGHTASSTETNLTPSATRAGGGLGHKAGYQPHIDGLRAIAVLSVVFYHLGLGPFPGGFVGVDVFFVISGFLISRIIYAETRRGDFSLSRFYVRRVRRIAPACSSRRFIPDASTGCCRSNRARPGSAEPSSSSAQPARWLPMSCCSPRSVWTSPAR